MASLPGYISDTELFYEDSESERYLLTGKGHVNTGSDNDIAGQYGTVTGNINALFSLDGASHTLTDDKTFAVWAENILFNGVAFAGYSGTGAIQFAEVAVSSSEILALRATPKTLVAAPGAGYLLEFIAAVLLLDATATAYVETADNLVIRYTGTTGTIASETIETTGFIDQTSDCWIEAKQIASVVKTKANTENRLLCLHNSGDSEYTTGTGVLRVKIAYRVWRTEW